MTRLGIGLLALAIIALAVVIMMVFSGMKKEPEVKEYIPPVKYAKTKGAKYENHNINVVAYGRLIAKDKIEVFSEVQGILDRTYPEFKIGNNFSKGSLLLKIDDRETVLNLKSQKSDFLNALTRLLPDMKNDFPSSYPKWEKYLAIFEIEGETEELPEPANSKEKYFIASRNLFKLYYTIKNLELRLSKHNIKAPFAGTVTMNMVEPGTLIRPGMKLGEFSGMGLYELELSVNRDEANYLRNGIMATVYEPESGNTWKGKITRISNSIDPATQTVKVFIQLSGNELKDGLYLRADIRGGEIDSAVRIPRRALINNKYVNIIRDTLLDRSEVIPILQSENEAYIRGVEPGTVLITEPLIDMPLGSVVKPLEDSGNN